MVLSLEFHGRKKNRKLRESLRILFSLSLSLLTSILILLSLVVCAMCCVCLCFFLFLRSILRLNSHWILIDAVNIFRMVVYFFLLLQVILWVLDALLFFFHFPCGYCSVSLFSLLVREMTARDASICWWCAVSLTLLLSLSLTRFIVLALIWFGVCDWFVYCKLTFRTKR